jgi:ketosteroid isomerase-like protein
MSMTNVEVVLKGVEAVNARDFDSLAELVAPEVEWDDTEGFAGLRGVHRGRAGVRGWLEAVLEPWESLHLEVEEITDAGERRVYLETLMSARGRASGVQTEIRVWMVFWLADGKIARRQLFWTRADALEAAGLSD